MGIIKFEVDIPDFDNEISMTIILKKDGEVVKSISQPSSEINTKKSETKARNPKKNLISTTSDKNSNSGNLMNVDFEE